MAANSNRKPGRRKTAKRPTKPYPEYPLYAHPLGYWSKKIRKSIKHFGRWGKVVNGKMQQLPYEPSWRAALATFEARVHDAQTGRIIESVVQESSRRSAQDAGGLTLMELCNRFLNVKLKRLDAAEITPRTLQEYNRTTDLLIEQFGKERLVDNLEPEDFERLRAAIAKGRRRKKLGPVRLGNEIIRIRSIFKYAVTNRLIKQAVEFGSEFNVPSKGIMRQHKAESDKKLFTASEVRLMLGALADDEIVIGKKGGKPIALKGRSNVQLRAAILLGINAGAGNTDVANLQSKHLDLKNRWLNYPRSKTGIGRRIPLWRETIVALREAIAARPDRRYEVDADCVLLTPRRKGDIRGGGTRLVVQGRKSRADYVSRQVSDLLHKLLINGRKNLGFYSLRHTFATVGLQTGDRDAVKALLGYVENDVLSQYDETGPSDQRLIAVTEHVHAWLFEAEKNEAHPLTGMVDKRNQRAAWAFADRTNPAVVFETSLFNLTKSESSMMVHYGASASEAEVWRLVRLETPSADSTLSAPSAPSAPQNQLP